jgi:hypothetical protein
LNELFAPAYNYVRLTQAIAWVLSAPAGDRGEPIRAVRVPIDRYRENLSHIREVFVKQDIPVILLTAPTSFYRLGVPDQLIKLMFGRDKDEIAALHRQYNEIVRSIDRVNTIDLEAEFDALSTEDMLEMFSTDGIHFTQIGLSRLGDRVAAAIADRTSFVPRR